VISEFLTEYTEGKYLFDDKKAVSLISTFITQINIEFPFTG